MKKRKEQKRRTRARVARRRLPGVPPPESKLWPEQYRGERWKPIYGILFAGRCQLCAYSCPLPKSRQLMDKWHGQTRLLLCANHPASPGELREVLPTDTCRNFKAKCWQRAKPRPGRRLADPTTGESGPDVRRIPVGQGLFAIVDAADYEMLSKHKWYAHRHGGTIYAVCFDTGRSISMHRMIMRPRKGYIVDHKDRNGLNNRRCNLRACTPAQNRTNTRRRDGSSRFAGVHREGNKWRAAIRRRGKYHNLGLFVDEVEAAKARDRKAYEFHGEYAYLNFPKDFGR